jgi:YwiC-like protein
VRGFVGEMITKTMPIPREHGAWAILYTPFLVALFTIGRWEWEIVPVLLMLTAVFFAHEPLMLLSRSQVGSGRRRNAIRWILIYSGIAALASLPLLFFFRLFLLIPFGAFSCLMMFVHYRMVTRKNYRSFAAEVLAIINLTSSAPMLYYCLEGKIDGTALLLWTLNALYFISSIFYVKMMVGRSSVKLRDYIAECASYHLLLLAALAAMACAGWIHWNVCLAFLPATFRAGWGMKTNRKLNLRRIGFAEMGVTLLYLVLIVVGLR